MIGVEEVLYCFICDLAGDCLAFENFRADADFVERIACWIIVPLRSRSKEHTEESEDAYGRDDKDEGAAVRKAGLGGHRRIMNKEIEVRKEDGCLLKASVTAS